MNEQSILTLARLPARLDVRQAALLLGFQEHDIPVLVRERLLKPLGNPMPNAHKYFSSVDVEELVRDRAWLDRATRAIARHWRAKNAVPHSENGERVEVN